MFPNRFRRIASGDNAPHSHAAALVSGRHGPGSVAVMTETAERYASVAAAFTERVRQVPSGAWDNPAPCEGWVARDVIRHIVETSAFFLSRTDAGAPSGPSVEDDPAGAWAAARDAVLAGLNDPADADEQTRLIAFTGRTP